MDGQPRSMDLSTFLCALPDEIWTVVGEHMKPGDLQAARLASKRWCQLLQPSTVELHAQPSWLAMPQHNPTVPRPQTRTVGGRVLRPRLIQPTPADLRQPPHCLQPPYDVTRLAVAFPGADRVTVRIQSRLGVRGEGINASPERVSGLLASLSALNCCRQLPHSTARAHGGHDGHCQGRESGPAGASAPAGPPPTNPADAQPPGVPQKTSQPASSPGGAVFNAASRVGAVPGGRVSMGGSTYAGQPGKGGLQLTVVLDVDIPRPRHKEAYAAAVELACITVNSVAGLGPHLTTLRVVWFLARLAHLTSLPDCLSRLTRLRRLELPLTPGALLPALAPLTALTALRIASVGDEMHMADLCVPRHDEILHVSHLTALAELHLDGWVCETSLLRVLMGLPGLRALSLGEELSGAAQELPLQVLTRLTAMTLPVPLTAAPPVADVAKGSGADVAGNRAGALFGAGSHAHGSAHSPGPGRAAGESGEGGSRSRRAAQHLELPRLEQFKGPAPCARVTGWDVYGPAHASAGGGGGSAGGVRAQGTGLAGEAPGGGTPVKGAGAARRQALTPQVITPILRDLDVDLGQSSSQWVYADLDLGPLTCLTRLMAGVSALSPEDLVVLDPLAAALTKGDLPALKELHVSMTRAQVSPAHLLAAPVMSAALSLAASSGSLARLEQLSLGRLWDGLVPEGWDYTTKGALGAAPGQRFSPSPLMPTKHLTFLRSLPALTTLHLHVDRVRLSLLPASLTSLTLEGLVHIDDPSTWPAPAPTCLPPCTGPHHAPGPNHAAATTATGWQCPKLKRLSVMLAKHPRTVPPTPGLPSSAPGLPPRPVPDRSSAPPPARPPLPPTATPAEGPGGALDAAATAPIASPAAGPIADSGAAPAPSVTADHASSRSTGREGTHSMSTSPAGAPGPPLRPSPAPTGGPLSSLAGPSRAAGGRAGTATASVTPAPEATKLERGSYCVLESLLAVLPLGLTHLSFSATPSPATSRADQPAAWAALTPADYGMHVIAGALPQLTSLQLYVMPKHAWLLDCRQLLPGLGTLPGLRSLNLESPLTGATRLVALTALSTLTQVTQLITGRLDVEAYPGRVMLGGCTGEERRGALAWLTGLVTGRFGMMPTLDPTPSGSLQDDAVGTTAGESDADTNDAGAGAQDDPGALQGSDVDISTDDLLFDSGGEEESSEGLVYALDEEGVDGGDMEGVRDL